MILLSTNSSALAHRALYNGIKKFSNKLQFIVLCTVLIKEPPKERTGTYKLKKYQEIIKHLHTFCNPQGTCYTSIMTLLDLPLLFVQQSQDHDLNQQRLIPKDKQVSSSSVLGPMLTERTALPTTPPSGNLGLTL